MSSGQTVHLQIKAEQKEIIQNVLERKDSMAECYQRASERACVTFPLFGQEKQENKGAKGGKDDTEGNNAEGGDNPESEKTEEAKKGALFDAFAISLGLKEEPKFETLLDSVDFNGIIKYIKDKKATNIITMAGAGISTSAGIPDFRSPETGLYSNLQKYNLPNPMAIFALDYFRENPEPFCMLARELWPGIFKPTLCHYFIRLLQEKGILLRHYTQNIDTLETIAGLDPEMCVEAHGHFRTGHCLNDECKTRYTQDWMKERIMKSEVPRCTVKGCGDLVKPDIVFFGEPLPFRFSKCANEDFEKCDLLIIMGTSLVVQPFASLPNRTNDQVPRLYINLENHCAPKLDPIMAVIFGKGFDFDGENNHRDVFWQGTCDDGCEALVDALGWGDELRALVKTEHEKIDNASNTTGASNTTPKKDTSVTTSKKKPSPETSKAPTKVTIPKKAETTPRADPKSTKPKVDLKSTTPRVDPKSTTPRVDPKSTTPSPSSSKSSQPQKPLSVKKK